MRFPFVSDFDRKCQYSSLSYLDYNYTVFLIETSNFSDNIVELCSVLTA